MIYGIGIDLLETGRMEKIVEKWREKFFARVFTDIEIAYCARHAQAAIHYGARFAAKEAFLKALGIGLGMGVKLREIGVIHDEKGKPSLKLSGQAKAQIEAKGIAAVHLSLSHTSKYATAVVVLEKK